MSKERLVELLSTIPCDNKDCCYECNGKCVGDFDLPCQKRALTDAILADGWIRPPCKVGDKVYEIVHGEILETEAVGFLVCQDGAILIITRNSFPLSREVGCCVFITREEAEAKLKESESE